MSSSNFIVQLFKSKGLSFLMTRAVIVLALSAPLIAEGRAQDVCEPQAVLAQEACGKCKEADLLISNTKRHQDFSPKQVHCYHVRVAAVEENVGEFIQVLVEQHGIDVVTTLCGLDGKPIVQIDTTSGTSGVEPISFVAKAPGTYILIVESPDEKGRPGSFDITLAQQRRATERDQISVKADWNFFAADVLRVNEDSSAQECAVEKFKLALPLYQDLHDRRAEAKTRNYLGYSLGLLRRYKEASEYVFPAAVMWQDLKDAFGEAEALNNLGFAYAAMGEIERALTTFELALPLWREARNQTVDSQVLTDIEISEGRTLINLTDLYNALGRSDKALSSLLKQQEQTQDPKERANLLKNIGLTYYSNGDHNSALKYFNAALDLVPRDDPTQRGQRAAILNSIGAMHAHLGDYVQSFDYLKQALAEYGDYKLGQAVVNNSFGGAYATRGSLDDKRIAVGYYLKALSLLEELNDTDRTADTLYNLAKAQRDLGLLSQAKASIEEAINYLEALRSRLIREELRRSFFAKKHFYYDVYIDILMRLHKEQSLAGYDIESLQVSDRARGRSLLDLLIAAKVSINEDIPAELFQRIDASQKRLTAAIKRRRLIMNTTHTLEQETAAEREVSERKHDFRMLQLELRNTKAATLIQPYALDFKQIQGLIRPETIILQYQLGSQRSFLWAITKGDDSPIVIDDLPGRVKLDELVREFRDAVTARGCHINNEASDERRKRIEDADRKYISAAAKLSETLLKPIAPFLGSKQIVIVADGSLQALPFGALPEPRAVLSVSRDRRRIVSNAPLMMKHEIVYLPSVTTLSELRSASSKRELATKTVAAIADPVFDLDDERVKQTNPTTRPALQKLLSARVEGSLRSPLSGPKCITNEKFERLPGTYDEATKITNLIKDEKKKLLAHDFQASVETMRSSELRDFKIIHVATHAFVPPDAPQQAKIVLSLVTERGEPQQGYFRLNDIYQLRLNAHLVTLSACETALGEDISGEGLVGLARGFMYAGVPRVTASLWKVDDLATSSLMSQFYSAILNEGLKPAAALRRSQTRMYQRKDEWNNPYYWAAFTFQGEWQWPTGEVGPANPKATRVPRSIRR